ncbi:MAG: hypothetical protein CMK32_02505, partial [Porticoccaceae bacterium]|nr:hypothetical protein [Porticoccaceae bacterium]
MGPLPNVLEAQELIIEDEEEIIFEDDTDQLAPPHEEDILILEDNSSDLTTAEEASGQAEVDVAGDLSPTDQYQSPIAFHIDDIWVEYGTFTRDNSPGDAYGHIRSEASLTWSSLPRWEGQLSARVYGYHENGNAGVDELFLDYGESYLRYISDQFRLTVGAQQVIWGRIDEFPPSDRLSTQDISRYVLDDLKDRRRASPAIRYEYFIDNSKLDFLILPYFRPATLPDTNSAWFPVNQDSGEVFGLASTPLTRQLVKTARIHLDEPNSEGGYGVRFSSILEGFDYAVTVQK